MPYTKMNVRPFHRILRQDGFILDYDSRAGGIRVIEWIKQINFVRQIRVQLWGDGQHRATHSISGNENTHPTYFTDIFGMRSAIETESIRQDNTRLI
jgi:hypothetical protein